MEIVDSQKKVILQVDIEGRVAQFKGIFHDKAGASYALEENQIEIRPPGTPLDVVFTPLFKHPEYKYLGERIP